MESLPENGAGRKAGDGPEHDRAPVAVVSSGDNDAREELVALLGMPRVTQALVAREAGCTQPWVSQMLGAHVRVSDEILRAARIVRRRVIGEGLLDLGMRWAAKAHDLLPTCEAPPELLSACAEATAGLQLAVDLFGPGLPRDRGDELATLAAAVGLLAREMERGQFNA